MPAINSDIDRILADLDSRVKRRRRWRGKPVFYQVLDYEMDVILAAAEDPADVKARVRAILVRHGHDPDPTPLTRRAQGFNQASHLVSSVPQR